jgi:hypothetical protein
MKYTKKNLRLKIEKRPATGKTYASYGYKKKITTKILEIIFILFQYFTSLLEKKLGKHSCSFILESPYKVLNALND